MIVSAPRAPNGFRPKKATTSPAYAASYGQVSTAVGASVGEAVETSGKLDWTKIGFAVLTGVAISFTSQLALDWVRGKGIWEGRGHLPLRTKKHHKPLEQSTFSLPSPFKR